MNHGWRLDETGAATVMVVAFLGLLLVIGAGTGAVAGVFVAHRRAESAADLAALAAARQLVRGGDPCPAAARIAGENGAKLEACHRDGTTVVVEVVVPGPTWLGSTPVVVGRARAGLA